MGGAIEEIEFPARSPTRVRILDELNDEHSLTRRELRDRLDGTRTTVGRNLDGLCEREWIETGNRDGNGEYAITPGGETIAEKFDDLAETIRAERRLRPFLRWVDRSAFDLDPRSLADAVVTVSDPDDPDAVMVEHLTALRSAAEVKALINTAGRASMETAQRRLSAGNASYEVVIEEATVETIRSTTHRSRQFDELVSSEAFDAYVYAGEIPYFVGLLDEVVQVGAYDEEGQRRALLEGDSEGISEWTEDTYSTYKRQSRELP